MIIVDLISTIFFVLVIFPLFYMLQFIVWLVTARGCRRCKNRRPSGRNKVRCALYDNKEDDCKATITREHFQRDKNTWFWAK